MSDLSSALSRAAGGTSRAKVEAPVQKQLLLRLDPAMHKRLKVLAAERETTVQALGREALDMLLKHYG